MRLSVCQQILSWNYLLSVPRSHSELPEVWIKQGYLGSQGLDSLPMKCPSSLSDFSCFVHVDRDRLETGNLRNPRFTFCIALRLNCQSRSLRIHCVLCLKPTFEISKFKLDPAQNCKSFKILLRLKYRCLSPVGKASGSC